MLSCFRGSGLTHLAVSVTPIYAKPVFLSWNLSTFSLICFCWHRSSKADSRASWLDVASSMVLPSPQMRMSSAMTLVPSSPSKLSSILLWYSSGATQMPKGILFHFILPTGVLKVVSRELGSSSGTCQKADLVSAKVNTLALLISVSRWSTVGIGYSGRLSAVFRGLESMQSLIPFLAEGF